MPKTMAYMQVGATMVVAHGPQPPAQNEWDGHIALCKDGKVKVRRLLVYTAGGAPDAKQRAQAEKEFGQLRVAVLTDSVLARGVVTALRWLGMPISAFPADQVVRAMEDIGVPSAERDEVRSALTRVRTSVMAAS
jgi:hypothetical protein